MRLNDIKQWLDNINHESTYDIDLTTIQAASNDASFRKYFRVSKTNNPNVSYIIMDAPPQLEDCTSFIDIADLFATSGVNVPKILHKNLQQGFLLLTDLGNSTYLQAINDKDIDVNLLYTNAREALLKIQKISIINRLESYSSEKLMQEMQLFDDWYLPQYCNYSLTNDNKNDLLNIYNILIKNVTNQHYVYVHRDYHCRNLMYTSDNNPGILDFQDAVYGPITYDLVSMWRDAYIEFDEEQQIDWLVRYWQEAKKIGFQVKNFDEFYVDYELMGLQRHLKVLGIFARLNYRDGKDNYLQNIPLVYKYAHKVAQRYSQFKPLLGILESSFKQSN